MLVDNYALRAILCCECMKMANYARRDVLIGAAKWIFNRSREQYGWTGVSRRRINQFLAWGILSLGFRVCAKTHTLSHEAWGGRNIWSRPMPHNRYAARASERCIFHAQSGHYGEEKPFNNWRCRWCEFLCLWDVATQNQIQLSSKGTLGITE
jgi:hypothetical protein